jgi:hypothetical protein
MNKKTEHKFQENMELTYERYFRDRYSEMIHLGRELERILGREKALDIIGKACEKFAIESTKTQVTRTEPIKSFEDFKKTMKDAQRSPFWTHALTLRFPKETRKELVFHITECLWAKTFKAMDATDLGYLICCKPDFVTARIYHPKIKMKRTKTLIQGDSYCNHTYYWGERKPMPRKVTKEKV